MVGRIGVVQESVPNLDGEFSRSVHGIARVDREVEQGIFELPRIGQRIPQAPRHHRIDFHTLADCPAQHVAHAVHQPPDIHHLRFQRLAAAESEKLVREFRAAADPFQRVCHPRLGAFVAGHVFRQKLQIAGHHLQQVVEIMRNAARELADCFQVLRLPQRAFRFGAAGDCVLYALLQRCVQLLPRFFRLAVFP